MNPSTDVHVLQPGDEPRLREMLHLFGRVFEDPASYIERQPDDAYLRALLARDGFVAIAALKDGQMIGGLAGYVLPKFEQARAECYIYDLAVDGAHRRQGVATALIRRLQHWAGERGIWVIFVQADHGDAPAIALYESLGTREEVLHFDIPPLGAARNAKT